jgi:hypothetical protein
MTYLQPLASVLRGLADHIDPHEYQPPPPVLPSPGDEITVVIVTAAGDEEFHGVVNVVQGRVEDGQGIARLVVQEAGSP